MFERFSKGLVGFGGSLASSWPPGSPRPPLGAPLAWKQRRNCGTMARSKGLLGEVMLSSATSLSHICKINEHALTLHSSFSE